jgi:hypothetical protein
MKDWFITATQMIFILHATNRLIDDFLAGMNEEQLDQLQRFLDSLE